FFRTALGRTRPHHEGFQPRSVVGGSSARGVLLVATTAKGYWRPTGLTPIGHECSNQTRPGPDCGMGLHPAGHCRFVPADPAGCIVSAYGLDHPFFGICLGSPSSRQASSTFSEDKPRRKPRPELAGGCGTFPANASAIDALP